MGRTLLSLALLVFAVYTAGTALTQVQPGERAVVRRFGRILPENPEQGLYIGWPWGIDRVERVPVGQVRGIRVGYIDSEDKEDEAVPAGQMLTGDHNLVNVRADIDFKVREADVDQFVLNANQSQALVERAAESLLAEWIAGRAVDEVILRGKIDLPRYLRAQLQGRLRPYHLGIEIEHVSIPYLFPPAQVKEAFDRLGQTKNNVEARLKQARQEADRRKSDLAGTMYNLRTLALKYAEVEPRNAETDATNFRNRLQQYRTLSAANPDYLNTLWLDDMTRLYAKMRAAGQIDLLDHYLTEGINITQFPLQAKKK